MLTNYAVANGHDTHVDSYTRGAIHERQGRHSALGKHKGALMHHASGYGLSGGHAEAYADGAMNEADGKHGAAE